MGNSIGAYRAFHGKHSDIGAYDGVPIINSIGAYGFTGENDIGAYSSVTLLLTQIINESIDFDILIVDTKQNTLSSYKNINYSQTLDLPEINKTLTTDTTVVLQINTSKSIENKTITDQEITLTQNINFEENVTGVYDREILLDLLKSMETRESTYVLTLTEYRKLQIFAEDRTMYVKNVT